MAFSTSIVIHETYYVEYEDDVALHRCIQALQDNLKDGFLSGAGWLFQASASSPSWDYCDDATET